jgi:hypothetical protein
LVASADRFTSTLTGWSMQHRGVKLIRSICIHLDLRPLAGCRGRHVFLSDESNPVS